MRPLRVLALLVPMAVSKLRGASNYNALVDLVKYSRKAGYAWYWYIPIPRRYEGEVRDDDFPSGCKVFFVENDCPDYYSEIAHTNSQLVRMFNHQYGTYPIDAVWTERTVAGVTWQRLLSRQANRKPIPVTICEPEVEDVRTINQETELMIRAVSAASCKYVVLNPDQVRLAANRYGKYLSASMLKRFRQSCRSLPLGCDLEVLDKAVASTPKAEEFTVLYGGRVAAIKRVDQVVKVMDAFYASGRRVKNLITTQTVGSKYLTDVIAGAQSVEFRLGVGREKFYEAAAGAHVFLVASDEESEGMGLWEGLYLTGAGAFADRPWVRGLMPPGWPYLWRDVDEGVAWLTVFYDSFQNGQMNGWTEKLRRYVRQNLNARLQAGKHMEVIAEGVDGWKGPTERSSIHQTVKLISDGFRMRFDSSGQSVTWQELAAVLKKEISVSPFSGRIRNDMPGVYDYYRMFLSMGWRDTCESEFPTFVMEGA